MAYDPERHHRRSVRLKGYDYSQAGAYFVTICTHQREAFFGEVVDGEMHCNANGQTIISCWEAIADHWPNVALDAFVVMPNHIHGILVITDDPTPQDVGAGFPRPLTPRPFRANADGEGEGRV